MMECEVRGEKKSIKEQSRVSVVEYVLGILEGLGLIPTTKIQKQKQKG